MYLRKLISDVSLINANSTACVLIESVEIKSVKLAMYALSSLEGIHCEYTKTIFDFFQSEFVTRSSYDNFIQRMDCNVFLVLVDELFTFYGAAELRIESGNSVTMLNFLINSDIRNQGVGTVFLKEVELYVSSSSGLSARVIRLIAGNNSRGFYMKNGYTYDGMRMLKEFKLISGTSDEPR